MPEAASLGSESRPARRGVTWMVIVVPVLRDGVIILNAHADADPDGGS